MVTWVSNLSVVGIRGVGVMSWGQRGVKEAFVWMAQVVGFVFVGGRLVLLG